MTNGRGNLLKRTSKPGSPPFDAGGTRTRRLRRQMGRLRVTVLLGLALFVVAVPVGARQGAEPPSRTLNVAGKLYRVEVTADVCSLSLAPFDGASGKLAMRSKLDT